MSIHAWLAPSSIRQFPHTLPSSRHPLCIEAALNEQFSFQVVLRQGNEQPQNVRLEITAPRRWRSKVRRIGCVPVSHHNSPILHDRLETDGNLPGFVPDPLFEEDHLRLPANETCGFWITLRPGAGARPGLFRVVVRIIPDRGHEQKLAATVRLHDIHLQPRRNFPITHWFYNDALMDWYRTDQFDRRFWSILPNYMQDLTAHGQDVIYVPVFTPPLDGVKRPHQLLRVKRVGKDRYHFDWTDVARYVRMARRCGLTHFEWCHPFTQWGVKHAIRIYDGQGRDEKLLWRPSTGATSPTYRRFLAQFLPGLRRFLDVERIHANSFFHVSDEPHGAEHLENYRKARALLQELAPWMKVMDALSEIDFARQRLTDMPIPSIQTALDFIKEGIPSWCYYCCGPRGRFLNHLLDTPLAKIAMHGCLFYRWPFRGFLHWGYNYWYESQTRTLIDPFTEQDGRRWHRGWAYGDTFLVYPGPNGPLDSIRWEVFAESLQDYQLLQTLGVPRDDSLLQPIRSFQDFPKQGRWRNALRSALFRRAAGC
jgi:hypothetical protein